MFKKIGKGETKNNMRGQYRNHRISLARIRAKTTPLLMCFILVSLMLSPGCKSKPAETIHLKVGLLPLMSASPGDRYRIR